jgi:hypothetical protein
MRYGIKNQIAATQSRVPRGLGLWTRSLPNDNLQLAIASFSHRHVYARFSDQLEEINGHIASIG